MALMTAAIAIDPGEHIVQFYEDESELARTVGRYLRDTVEAGAAGIVIATDAHRRAFGGELAVAAIDVTQCERDGTLILLDAAETTAQFVRDGRIDRQAFRRLIGSIVSRAGASGRPVRAYGEMVALLWEAGDVVAAIELEECWNELSAEFPFALLCGYHHESVLGHEHAEALRQVCSLHARVLRPPAGEAPGEPGPAAELCAQFPAEPGAVRSARLFAADALRRWGHAGSLLDDVQLVVSELATNAIVHARCSFRVAVREQGRGVRLSVRDASAARPTVRDGAKLAPSGRGLRLVAALAGNWGVDLDVDGKTVWAELGA
jgi:anti-sigma regulatory factor (Ser/Thr protein kinase)